MMMTETTQTTLFETASAPISNGQPTAPTGDAAPLAQEAKERHGYQFVKHVGWVPRDWDARALRTAGRIVTGSTPATSNEGYYGGPYPFVGPGDLGGFKTVSASDRTLSEVGLSQTRPVPVGSVLFTCISFAIGKTGQAGTLLATNQQINAVVPNERHDGDFLYYLLTFLSGRIKRLAGIQATPILNKSDFGSVLLPIPPLPEQREIARTLGAWDRALADLAALIEAKRRWKQGLAQRLLTGRARLPEFRGAGMTESRIGPVPSDWQDTRFGKVFRKRSEKNAGSALTHVITVGKYSIRPQSEHFDKSVASADLSAYNVIRPGDFVYDPMSAYYGAIGRYDGSEPGIVSPVYRVLTLRRGFDTGFVKHLLGAHYVRHRIASYSTQGNKEGKRRGLQHDAFEAIPVYAPSEPEQQAIAAVLDAAGAELAALVAQRDALARQKRGLMQRLLTGEVRVTPTDTGTDPKAASISTGNG